MKAPDANRSVLVLIAGALWSLVGIWLIFTAARWLTPGMDYYRVIWIVSGCIAGLIIHQFGFSRLVSTNLRRIFSQAPGKDKVCIFAFQNTRSYIVIIIMIGLGYVLRHLPVPKIYIASIYLAIGLALLLSSLLYYRRLLY